MEKNETFQGVCEDYTYEGAGVVHWQGFVFFVPGLIVGEEAEIAVTAMKKNYGYGRIVRLLQPSVHRCVPGCSVYRQCGGCQLLHMDLAEQLRFKQEKVAGCFRANAGLNIQPQPIVSAGVSEGYRNKVQVPVACDHGQVQMGFYQSHSNRIVEFDRCLVQTDLSNQIVAAMRQWLQELGCAQEFRHILIKHAHRSGQVMIVWIVRDYPFAGSGELIRRTQEKFPMVRSLQALINRRSDNVILDGKEVLLAGTPYIEEQLLDCKFRISARSFYQINPYATSLLYQKVLEDAQLDGRQIVIDLYCGTGTIGILAARHAKKVYGIEIVADAIKDARVNADLNGISNIEFVTADAQVGAQQILRSKIHPDTVIVDPPRKGCSRSTLEAISQMAPARLVYVSCDPATLARDCQILAGMNFQVVETQPFDLFPGTVHIENCCLLTRNHCG